MKIPSDSVSSSFSHPVSHSMEKILRVLARVSAASAILLNKLACPQKYKGSIESRGRMIECAAFYLPIGYSHGSCWGEGKDLFQAAAPMA
ncbi:MAG: hypothetical protein K0A99_00660 [Desulfoarculaceae bacterium]|nr:hypothetical protein [Desulfoarculaceae bacterium]